MERVKSILWKHRVDLVFALGTVLLLLFLYGVYRLASYSIPMARGDYSLALQSISADRSVVHFDAGMVAYRREDLETARQDFAAAYSALTASNGMVPDNRAALASQIQFHLGNCLAKEGKVSAAIEAYKQCLRLDCRNLYAKYNLEMLRKNHSGSASPDQSPLNGAGQGSNKKI